MQRKPREMHRPELDAMLGRSDPYDFWRSEARLHAASLGLEHDTTDRALDTVVNAFGREWIDAELNSRKEKKFKLFRIDRHPVAGWIDMPSAATVSEMVELAAYLRALEHVDGFAQVIPMLRTLDQFGRAQTQLAFAYRFMRCGGEQLRLEPDTDNGRKADIAFALDSCRYVVECYAPEHPHKLWYADVCDHSMKKIVGWADENGRAIVCITLKQEKDFSAEVRKALEKDCKIELRRLPRHRPQGHLSVVRDLYDLEFFDTTDIPDHKESALVKALADQRETPFISGMDGRAVPKSHLRRIARRGTSGGGRSCLEGYPTRSRVRLAVPEVTRQLDDEAERLAANTEMKVAQLRMGDEDVRGLLVVERAIHLSDAAELDQTCARLHAKVLVNHPRVAGVLLVQRHRAPGAERSGYSAVMIGGQDEITGKLWHRLGVFERAVTLAEL